MSSRKGGQGLMIDVYAAVILNGKKVFLAKRNEHSHQGGLWEFPGGKIEPGESPRVCLERELFEELGVRAFIGEYITESIFKYPEKEIRLLAYFASISEKPSLREHEAFMWVSFKELLDYPLAPADRPIAQAVITKLENNK